MGELKEDRMTILGLTANARAIITKCPQLQIIRFSDSDDGIRHDAVMGIF